MTPIEKFEYRHNWLREHGGHSCTLHSDLENQALEWCRKNIKPETFHRYTDWPYQVTWLFEHEDDLKAFMLVCEPRFYNQEKI